MKNKNVYSAALALLILLLAIQFFLSHNTSVEQNDTPVGLTYYAEDEAMQTAIAKAQATLDEFLVLADSSPNHLAGFSLKVLLTEGEAGETFWLYPFQQGRNGGFSGRVNDEPKALNDVFVGEVVQVQRTDVIDWTYDNKNNQTMYGNYTGCVELQRQAPEYAQQFRELYGLNCDK